MNTAPAKPESLPPDAPGEDVSVLLSARNGSEPALGHLIRQHQTSVFTLALRFTGNRADAEELAQDTFLEMHGALSQISSPLHLRHWLLRTVLERASNQETVVRNNMIKAQKNVEALRAQGSTLTD